MTLYVMKGIGYAFLFVGLFGCLIVIASTALYAVIRGDKYGSAKKTCKEGLYLFAPLLIAGILITLFTF